MINSIHYIYLAIKILAVKVKRLLDLQGRTLANPLHMLAVNDLDHFVNLESLLEYIIRRKSFPLKEFEVIRSTYKSTQNAATSFSRMTSLKSIATKLAQSLRTSAMCLLYLLQKLWKTLYLIDVFISLFRSNS